MTDESKRLNEALRAIAQEDAASAPERPTATLLAALRTGHLAPGTRHQAPGTQHPGTWHPGTWHPGSWHPGTWHPGRLLGFGLAATLAAAVSGAMWFVTSDPPSLTRRTGASYGGQASGEIVSAFMPLTYSALPYTDAQIVRLEVPRSALRNFGLAPADLPADAASAVSTTTVLADVLVGEDGLARAVRFVRAERAPGVAP